MKRLLVLVATLAVATAVSGCASVGGPRFTLFPTAEVVVLNNCPMAATLVVNSLHKEWGRIRYGDKTYVALASSGYGSMYLTAQGYDANGLYLGSASQSFSSGSQYGPSENVWSVEYLQGGRGCIPPRPP